MLPTDVKVVILNDDTNDDDLARQNPITFSPVYRVTCFPPRPNFKGL